MAFAERKEKLLELGQRRKSRVVALFHSDRGGDIQLPGLAMPLAQDQIPIFHSLLRKLGQTDQIDLWLYTRGGDMNVPWPLVNAIRSYTKHFDVLIPFRAHSAGTLISMGADHIVAGPAAELSPVDPTTANQFNPRDPNNPAAVLGISVEEVTAFIEMAKDSIGIKESTDLVSVLQVLAKDISPIALGNVHRTYTQIREVSKKLLGLHMDSQKDEEKIRGITDKLTYKLYSHLHAINRKEAGDLGLEVTNPVPEEESLMWDIYEDYAREVELDKQFNIRGFLGNKLEQEITLKAGFIEASETSYACEAKLKLTQASQLPERTVTEIIQGRQKAPTGLVPGLPIRVEAAFIGGGWNMVR